MVGQHQDCLSWEQLSLGLQAEPGGQETPQEPAQEAPSMEDRAAGGCPRAGASRSLTGTPGDTRGTWLKVVFGSPDTPTSCAEHQRRW